MKVLTHVYYANLILDELRNNVVADYYSFMIPFRTPPWKDYEYQFGVRREYAQAILAYPTYFRAGAMGPDVFPDIYIGQSIIHPEKSSVWIDQLWQRKSRYADHGEITAFLLGFMLHHAGDLFGHTYINAIAGDVFPASLIPMNATKLHIITKHIAAESYIDEKIPLAYLTPDKLGIDIPEQFVLGEMIYDNNNKNALSSIFGLSGKNPLHIKTFIDLRVKLANDASRIHFTAADIAWAILTGGLSVLLKVAKKKYYEAWVDDIDRGLAAWVPACKSVAWNMLHKERFDQLLDPIEDWSLQHLLKMMGFPDIAADTVRALVRAAGSIQDFVKNYLGPVYNTLQQIKQGIYDHISEAAFGISVSELKNLFKNPRTYLTNAEIAKLDADMGNFNTCILSNELTFQPAYDSILLGKMILMCAKKEPAYSTKPQKVVTQGIQTRVAFPSTFKPSTFKAAFKSPFLIASSGPAVTQIPLQDLPLPPPPRPGTNLVLRDSIWMRVPDTLIHTLPGPNPFTIDTLPVAPIKSGDTGDEIKNVNFMASLDGGNQWQTASCYFYKDQVIFKSLFIQAP